MFTLDCSTRSQVLLTLSAGFGCAVAEMENVLLSIDLEKIYETDHSIMIDSSQYLREYVYSELGIPGTFTTALWFHGTRTFADNTFENGLFALNQSESLVMDMLVNLAPDAEAKERLQAWNFHAAVPDFLFQTRTKEKIHWGPYGHLVREVHLHARKLWQHDYVRLPELVEDVCNAYKKTYGRDLTEYFLKVLNPCIVWFRANIDYQEGALEAALSYAYTSVRKLPPESDAVYGIDRHGKRVSADDIVNVEFILTDKT
ncbi:MULTISPECIES: hypothetical protein [Klebsiella pneumoniae complex]|uniref:Uncharacterized protein n=1 Tax=Klebsiella pneumoniae TaxID=573 RepID=A0A486TTI2_KLEPN|nr:MULTISPECIES: hypothetical protein [Klebsiella]EKU3517802.1 hypothetical protein [Klebsiella quasipneumoniae]NKD42261.1 hypothetical protein [Escherichia coli]EKX7758243.1 hypothetical protein [Klebsiella quasipneumoniae]MCH6141777.1 hypothetical protein [Klebsiella variicola]MCH6176688.1 hypothetical protein [Klebsiella variicola]